MGVFDYIRCNYPLPDGWKPATLLQTQDLDPWLENYAILETGELMLEHVEHERPADVWIPLSAPGCPHGRFKQRQGTKSTWRKVSYTGWLNFYGGDDDDWHEYNAQFENGCIVKIEVVSPTK